MSSSLSLPRSDTPSLSPQGPLTQLVTWPHLTEMAGKCRGVQRTLDPIRTGITDLPQRVKYVWTGL